MTINTLTKQSADSYRITPYSYTNYTRWSYMKNSNVVKYYNLNVLYICNDDEF